jgi:hypothetical protein
VLLHAQPDEIADLILLRDLVANGVCFAHVDDVRHGHLDRHVHRSPEPDLGEHVDCVLNVDCVLVLECDEFRLILQQRHEFGLFIQQCDELRFRVGLEQRDQLRVRNELSF